MVANDPKEAIDDLKAAEEKKVVAKEEKKDDKKEAKSVKDAKDAKVEELTNDLKRLQAEFENYKKRVEKENARYREYTKMDFVKKLLPVLDSFDIAMQNTKNPAEFIKGVELIYAQLYSILKEEGLQPIEAAGKKFDPYIHEVLLFERSDKSEDTVLDELQKGYKCNNCVIRHTKVKVAKK